LEKHAEKYSTGSSFTSNLAGLVMSASDKLEYYGRDMEEASSSFINKKLADEPWPYCAP
jgi:hypothetical protein